jgi:hypothetical protein
MPVVPPEKDNSMGWAPPVLTVSGQFVGTTPGVVDVMGKPLLLVEPDHTETPLKFTFFRLLLRVAQKTVIESM